MTGVLTNLRCLGGPVAAFTAVCFTMALAPRQARAAPDDLASSPTPQSTPVAVKPDLPSVADVAFTPLGGGGKVDSAPTGAAGAEVMAQTVSVPQGAGAIGGMGEAFSAQLSTGVASLTLPFALVRARGNLQPQLVLSYLSSAGRGGVAGVGWDMSVPSISRQTSRGVPKYLDPLSSAWAPGQDRFVYGGDELVPICRISSGSCVGAASGEAMPKWGNGWSYFRTRVDSQSRFFWSPDRRTWRIQDKAGVTLELGAPKTGPAADASDAGAIETDETGARIFRWNLSRQYDARESSAGAALDEPMPVNIVVYRYVVSSGLSLLRDIYINPPAVGATSASPTAYSGHVRLEYEARPDPLTSFVRGWEVRHAQRLVRVDVTSRESSGSARSLVRRFHMKYLAGVHASVLASAQIEGRCATPVTEDTTEALTATSCPRMPAVTFEYTQPTDSVGVPLPTVLGGFEGISTTLKSVANSPLFSMSEQRAELVDVNADGLPDVLVTAPEMFSGNHRVFLNGTGGEIDFKDARPLSMAATSSSVLAKVSTGVLTLKNPNVVPLDFDGDGLLDLVHMPLETRYTVFSPVPTAGGFEWAGREVAIPLGSVPKVDLTKRATNVRSMDVDGDGLVDIVHTTGTEMQTFFALGRFPGGDGQFGTAAWTSSSTATVSPDPTRACLLWSATTVQFDDPDVHVADMNGDGLPDIVRIRKGDIRYWPGRGNGVWGTGSAICPTTTPAADRAIVMASSPLATLVDPAALRLADVNGDGLPDLVQVRFGAVDVWMNVDGVGWSAERFTFTAPPTSAIGNRVRVADIDGTGTTDIVWGDGGDYKYVDLMGGVRPWLLRRASNGLGATTTIDYSSSAAMMLDAKRAGSSWSTVMPVVTHVVRRVSVSTNTEPIGVTPRTIVKEYAYRDPLWDGREREFRGFRTTRETTLGDLSIGAQINEATFYLGDCSPEGKTPDPCAIENRWMDNPRDALKGFTKAHTLRDSDGVTHSISHYSVGLNQLYTGLDGRSVRLAFGATEDTWRFDTGSFVGGSATASVDGVVRDGIAEGESIGLPSSQYAWLRSTSTIDGLGNLTRSSSHGCIAGAACVGTDERIDRIDVWARPAGDKTGWIYRAVESWVAGSSKPSEKRLHRIASVDPFGGVLASSSELVGSLALVRTHEGGGAVAPAPAGASVDGWITMARASFDVFGNTITTGAAGGRCRTVEY